MFNILSLTQSITEFIQAGAISSLRLLKSMLDGNRYLGSLEIIRLCIFANVTTFAFTSCYAIRNFSHGLYQTVNVTYLHQFCLVVFVLKLMTDKNLVLQRKSRIFKGSNSVKIALAPF